MADAASTDIERIRRTLASYCQLCDDGRFDEWAELYTPDATFEALGRTYTGREQIKGFIETYQAPELRGKHITGNALIDVDSIGAVATASTDYVFVGPTAEGLAVISAGRYHDTLVRDGDRWLFRRRKIVFVGDE
jgi:3-phenylpropionate/cinnamic acid dioxygenase small subunit